MPVARRSGRLNLQVSQTGKVDSPAGPWRLWCAAWALIASAREPGPAGRRCGAGIAPHRPNPRMVIWRSRSPQLVPVGQAHDPTINSVPTKARPHHPGLLAAGRSSRGADAEIVQASFRQGPVRGSRSNPAGSLRRADRLEHRGQAGGLRARGGPLNQAGPPEAALSPTQGSPPRCGPLRWARRPSGPSKRTEEGKDLDQGRETCPNGDGAIVCSRRWRSSISRPSSSMRRRCFLSLAAGLPSVGGVCSSSFPLLFRHQLAWLRNLTQPGRTGGDHGPWRLAIEPTARPRPPLA